MNFWDNFRILDIIDIVLVATLFYYIYKLVKGTVAIRILAGIIVVAFIAWLTDLLKMEMLSTILGQFIGVGIIALIVVFQPEIRKFLLMIGSTNLKKSGLFKTLHFMRGEDLRDTDLEAILKACENMAATKTGALIVIKRTTNLDFIKSTGDQMDIEVNRPIIESIFYKNATLHDGAVIIEGNRITATRAILPVSNERTIPLRFGLRHRAALGVTEKTDAVALVVSEETGEISYMRNGEFALYESTQDLINMIHQDLS
ncbi:diadenylate cyclase CdaA [Croceiramulus getboli]|nr:diadenylate cyclase CdaA [Flavobacteriaceae bacterium YJPT1-3]